MRKRPRLRPPAKRGDSSDDQEAARKRAEEAFVEGVVARGEAAKPGPNGKLPPGATHEIVEEREGRPPKLRRRRFSLF
jgi:hypothetical protein